MLFKPSLQNWQFNTIAISQDSDRGMTQGDGKSLEDSPRQASFVNAGSGSELGSGLGVQPEIWWN